MARVGLLCPDLLFGSKVVGALSAAGHEVVEPDASGFVDVLVVDLTADVDTRLARFGAMKEELEDVPALAFYSHVELDVRRAAEDAGFDLVVPRSRMAREAASLIEGLL